KPRPLSFLDSAHEPQVGEILQGGVERPRAGSVLAMSALLQFSDHLVAVPGTPAEEIEEDKAGPAPLHPEVTAPPRIPVALPSRATNASSSVVQKTMVHQYDQP